MDILWTLITFGWLALITARYSWKKNKGDIVIVGSYLAGFIFFSAALIIIELRTLIH